MSLIFPLLITCYTDNALGILNKMNYIIINLICFYFSQCGCQIIHNYVCDGHYLCWTGLV